MVWGLDDGRGLRGMRCESRVGRVVGVVVVVTVAVDSGSGRQWSMCVVVVVRC